MSERAAKVRVARRRFGTPPAASGSEVDAQRMASPSGDAEPRARSSAAGGVEPSADASTSAAGLVAALWHLRPPDAWADSRPVAAEAGLRATLLRLAEAADAIGGGTSVVAAAATACAAAQLLGPDPTSLL